MTGEEPPRTDGGPTDGGNLADGRYTAVLDRFEETDPETDGEAVAILLLESGKEVVAERAVSARRLPADARRQDAVLKLVVNNGFVSSMAYDEERTDERRSSAQSRFDRLAERPADSDEE
jgi:hypothetical protein